MLNRIADKLLAMSTLEATGELVSAVVNAGRLIWEAHRAGALDAIEWVELAPCFDRYASGIDAGAPLAPPRILFGCLVGRLAKNCPEAAAKFGFRVEGEHVDAYEWEWVRSSLRSFAELIRAEAMRIEPPEVQRPSSAKKGRPASGNEKWRKARLAMIDLMRRNKLPAEIRDAATLIKHTNSTTLTAVHRSPLLAAHFRIDPTKVPDLIAALIEDFPSDLVGSLKAMDDAAASQFAEQWDAMDADRRAQVAQAIMSPDRSGGKNLLCLIENADSDA